MEALINGLKWTIQDVEAAYPMLIVDSCKKDGACHFRQQEIYLDRELPPDYKRQVLLHELAHVMLAATQLDTKNDTFTEEELCNFVGIYTEQIYGIAMMYSDWKPTIVPEGTKLL